MCEGKIPCGKVKVSLPTATEGFQACEWGQASLSKSQASGHLEGRAATWPEIPSHSTRERGVSARATTTACHPTPLPHVFLTPLAPLGRRNHNP